MKQKKLFIFDMGNTILDFHGGLHTDEEKDELGLVHMSQLLRNDYGLEISSVILKEKFLLPWYQDFYKREELIELDVEDYLKPVLKGSPVTLFRGDYIKIMRAFYKEYVNEVILHEGALAVFAKLKENGVSIGILSNCILYDEIYIDVFKRMGLAPFIDQYFFSYSRKIRKPDERLFKEVLECFKVEASEGTMVGDNIKADIEPAKNLGLSTIWVNRKNIKTGNMNRNLADMEIRDLRELLALYD